MGSCMKKKMIIVYRAAKQRDQGIQNQGKSDDDDI